MDKRYSAVKSAITNTVNARRDEDYRDRVRRVLDVLCEEIERLDGEIEALKNGVVQTKS